MNSNFVGALIAFAAGALICFGNYLLSEYFLKHKKDKFSAVSLIRQVIQVGYLLAAFFLAGYTPWDRTYLLIGAALGVTLPMLISTYKLLKTNSSDEKINTTEDNADG